MNTVQKNNTITKKQVQEILEKNQGTLNLKVNSTERLSRI